MFRKILTILLVFLPTRIVLGLVWVCLLPSVILWYSGANYIKDIAIYSLGTSFFVCVLTLLTLQRLARFPGRGVNNSIVPTIAVWSGVAISALMFLRVPYSSVYLAFSCMFLLMFCYIHFIVTQKAKKTVMSLIPCGRAQQLINIEGVQWNELKEVPCRVAYNYKVPIVTDLHSKDLSAPWQNFLARATLQGTPVYHHRQVRESLTGRVQIKHLYENELGSLLPSKAYLLVKRVLDIALIILSSPLILSIMVITALLIVIESRGGVFFLQERIGQGGKPFTMYKFRSMYTGTATDKTTSDSDERVTKIGKFIRKTRIDELPQFYNVLRGEMSLIGPRAEFYKFAEEYEKEIPFYSYRHIVKPGISGWAQVTQGYNFGIEDTKVKLEYDFYYIKNFSFSLDLLIFFKTIQTMLTGFGAR